ncbi:TetR/AcrR family transcriptional regulator [Nocardia veterana]|uniref:TetR/AcrR family transcriptional regulator n=1 Tax=Nocardia veterana TaxID=132249 RepID=A0A7X6LV70_9NOCA|nr:TetR/AcrR family transcriptional regulator [Nocardia veterana]NKY85185.1 TetR/AcrR family transcriptional regulator [Nocardia veterana]
MVSRVGRRSAPRVTREEIVDAAIRVIDRDGPQPSMDAIARAAGMTKPRLYRQFADKAELYTEIADRMARTAFASAGADMTLLLQPPKPALRRVFTTYAEGILEHPNVFRFLMRAPVVQTARSSRSGDAAVGAVLQFDLGRDAARRFARVARAVAAAVPIETDGLDYLSRAVVGVVVATSELWLAGSEPPRRMDEFVERTTDLVWSLLDGFLRGQGIVADPELPIFSTLAAVGRAEDAR